MEEVRPALKKLLSWMEKQPEPERSAFSSTGPNEDEWGLAAYEWRQVYPAQPELTASLEAGWQSLNEVSPEHVMTTRADKHRIVVLIDLSVM